jgi:hypothetical protein
MLDKKDLELDILSEEGSDRGPMAGSRNSPRKWYLPVQENERCWITIEFRF